MTASMSFPASSFAMRAASESASSFWRTTRPSSAMTTSLVFWVKLASSRIAFGITTRPEGSTDTIFVIHLTHATSVLKDWHGNMAFPWGISSIAHPGLVRLDGQSRDSPEGTVPGNEPLAVPLADRRDEQVRRGHLLAPFDEEGAQASSLRVRFPVEVQEDEGIQEVLRPLQAAAPLQMSSDEDLRRRGRGHATRLARGVQRFCQLDRRGSVPEEIDEECGLQARHRIHFRPRLSSRASFALDRRSPASRKARERSIFSLWE